MTRLLELLAITAALFVVAVLVLLVDRAAENHRCDQLTPGSYPHSVYCEDRR